MKVYINFPFREDWILEMRDKRFTSIQIGIGIRLSWNNFKFKYPSKSNMWPKKDREGRHKFTLFLFFMYWNMEIIFYHPEKF